VYEGALTTVDLPVKVNLCQVLARLDRASKLVVERMWANQNEDRTRHAHGDRLLRDRRDNWLKTTRADLDRVRESLVKSDFTQALATADLHLVMATDCGDWEQEYAVAAIEFMDNLRLLLSVGEAREVLESGRFDEVAGTMKRNRQVPPRRVVEQVKLLLAEWQGTFDEAGLGEPTESKRYRDAILGLCKPHALFWRQLLVRLWGVSASL
jgi:hypothetical protein